jgi:hypothetical protein
MDLVADGWTSSDERFVTCFCIFVANAAPVGFVIALGEGDRHG